MSIRLISILIWVCFLTASPSIGSKKGRNLAKEEVATIWIGLTPSGYTGYRFDLRLDGKGRGAIMLSNSAPLVFDISSWTFQNGKIRISVEPMKVGNSEYSRRFVGEVVGTEMTVFDQGDDWKVRVELRREAEVSELWDGLRQAMKKTKTQE